MPVTNEELVGAVLPQLGNDNYTAAELTALAAAGGLTPYATYVASDESPYQQWALDASTLGSPLGGEYMDVQVAGASGGVIVV